MNRIDELFSTTPSHNLSIYFTAGFPALNDTRRILTALDEAGADLVEIGMPYSDPVADGETIQQSNQQALENGMTIRLLFEQLEGIRQQGITMPVLLMGYLNPVVQFGIEQFCERCAAVGVDGLILPDLPMDVYVRDYKAVFDRYGLLNIFLVTPHTSEARIRHIDQQSTGFIYTVSSASVTGATSGVSNSMETYFERINSMQLATPRLIGFGIKDHATFMQACAYAQGAIIGSEFIRMLATNEDIPAAVTAFVSSVKTGQ